MAIDPVCLEKGQRHRQERPRRMRLYAVYTVLLILVLATIAHVIKPQTSAGSAWNDANLITKRSRFGWGWLRTNYRLRKPPGKIEEICDKSKDCYLSVRQAVPMRKFGTRQDTSLVEVA